MSDLISRRAAINTVLNIRQKCDTNDIDDYRDILVECFEELPTAAPSVVTMKLEVDKESLRKAMEEAELTFVAEPRKGKWIKEKALFQYQEITVWRCDQCGRLTNDWSDKYCSGCGARMEESE